MNQRVATGVGSAPARGRRSKKAPSDEQAPVYLDVLDRLEVKAIWRYLRKQPPSFWLISTYFFFEYVRPQQIYESLEGFPYTQTVLIASAVAWLIEGLPLRKWTMGDTFIALYSLAVLTSTFSSYYPSDGMGRWDYYFPWVLVFILITNLVTTRGRIFIFIGAFLLWSLKMSQHATRSWMMDGFVFRQWGATGTPGWFENSGDFAVQMVIFIPLAIQFARVLQPHLGPVKKTILYAIAVTGIVGVLASSSRGGQLGALAALIFLGMWTARRYMNVRSLLGGAVVVMLVLVLLPEQQRERFTTMGDDRTSQLRLTLWENGLQIMNEHPGFGIGYGNWIPYYRSRYDPQGQVVHNIYLEAGSEMGYTGLLLLLFGLSSVFIINHRTRKIADNLGGDGEFFVSISHGLDAGLFGFMVSGFFVTVLYYPFFWIQLSLTVALHTAALNTRKRLRKAGVPVNGKVGSRGRGRGRGQATRPRRMAAPAARYGG